MSNKHHIEKGMFLRGGAYPARMAHTPARHGPSDHSLTEIKGRLENLREAINYIQEKPSTVETQEEWLKRHGYW
jgi:hypothetical protein